MPLFYLHLINDRYVRDLEGTCFHDLGAARREAVGCAREFMSQQIVRHGDICLHHRIEIEDAHGKLVDTVRFGDAIAIEAEDAQPLKARAGRRA